MIIAIDETGSFNANSFDRSFFVAAHIRQRKTLYKMKNDQFMQWENSLPRSLKNAKGEIKSSLLSNEQLTEFVRRVIYAPYFIGVTPYCIRPLKNPRPVVEKYRTVHLDEIREGVKEFRESGESVNEKFYDDFGNWLRKLNYIQYLKIFVLGGCITAAFVNTVGHAITGGYDDELTRIKFVIDRDFIKEPRHSMFWHEVLRNQLYYYSKKNPLPLLKSWKRRGHPFLEKYMHNGRLNFNELFWKRCSFEPSHENFEIRIADAVNTILSRYFNRRECQQAYSLIHKCFLRSGKVIEMLLQDFNVDDWRYDPADNPWRNMSNDTLEQKQ